MSEADTIDAARLPLTVHTLAEQLRACGLAAGHTVLVHTRMSALGWIAGGPVAVIEALLHVLTPAGTLMVPAFSADNSEPAGWQHPPVPEAWWPLIRAHTPAYDARMTPTRGLGRVAELFRTWPGVQRSAHPQVSFAAAGPHAETLLAGHTSLTHGLGEQSPLAKLYALDGYVLLLGIDHSRNSSLHLAEYRANLPRTLRREGAAMLVDAQRAWVPFDMIELDDDDFAALGADYEAAGTGQSDLVIGQVGRGTARLLRQRPLVDYAVGWLEMHRTRPLNAWRNKRSGCVSNQLLQTNRIQTSSQDEINVQKCSKLCITTGET